MLICFVYRFGARDAKARNKQKEYDFIMDEEIEFVQVLQMPGTRKDKVHLLEFFLSHLRWKLNEIFRLPIVCHLFWLSVSICTR